LIETEKVKPQDIMETPDKVETNQNGEISENVQKKIVSNGNTDPNLASEDKVKASPEGQEMIMEEKKAPKKNSFDKSPGKEEMVMAEKKGTKNAKNKNEKN